MKKSTIQNIIRDIMWSERDKNPDKPLISPVYVIYGKNKEIFINSKQFTVDFEDAYIKGTDKKTKQEVFLKYEAVSKIVELKYLESYSTLSKVLKVVSPVYGQQISANIPFYVEVHGDIEGDLNIFYNNILIGTLTFVDGVASGEIEISSEIIGYGGAFFVEGDIEISAFPSEKCRLMFTAGDYFGSAVVDIDSTGEDYMGEANVTSSSTHTDYTKIYCNSAKTTITVPQEHVFMSDIDEVGDVSTSGYSGMEYSNNRSIPSYQEPLNTKGGSENPKKGNVTKDNTSLIPSDYTLLEYIQSTGSQYINLDFGFDKTDEIDIEFSVDSVNSNDKYIIAPIKWNDNKNRFGMGFHTRKTQIDLYTFAYGNVTTSNTFLEPNKKNDNQIHRWVYTNLKCMVMDMSVSIDVSNITFGKTTANLRLFYGYNSPTKGKIKHYKHKKKDFVIDLYPVKRNDDEIGMYDIASGRFYTNDGSDKFSGGEEIKRESESPNPLKWNKF